MLLGRLERERLKMNHLASSLLVRRVQSDIESQTRFQASDGEKGRSRRDVADQFTGLRVVHLHNELLLEAAVETGRTLHLQRLSGFVEDRAVRERIRFSCFTIGKKENEKSEKVEGDVVEFYLRTRKSFYLFYVLV